MEPYCVCQKELQFGLDRKGDVHLLKHNFEVVII